MFPGDVLASHAFSDRLFRRVESKASSTAFIISCGDPATSWPRLSAHDGRPNGYHYTLGQKAEVFNITVGPDPMAPRKVEGRNGQ